MIETHENGVDILYNYDKAGRMLGYTGGPTNTYGWLDKVIKTGFNYGVDTIFTYWPDGQLATEGNAPAVSPVTKVAYSPRGVTEHFLWDGLAILRRDDTIYITEPHANGGSVIASHPVDKPGAITYYLNDLLGTTLASVQGGAIEFDNTTSFGQLRSQIAPVPVPAKIGVTPPTVSPK